jgi:hypothetical protein
MTMQVTQTPSWDDLKCEYFHNLKTLKTSIDVAQNSLVEMNRIYLDVIKKSRKTGKNTLKTFTSSWIKKIDVDHMSEFPDIKEEHEKIFENPSEKNLADFGYSVQQKLYNDSIARLSAYRASMNAFYDTWKEMWPDK